jgi:hypothetical protein
MTFHDSVRVGDPRDDRSILFNLLVLVEVGRESSENEDSNLVMRLESRSHLLVGDILDELVVCGISVLLDERLRGVNSKLESTIIVDNFGGIRAIIFIVIFIKFIVFLARKSILDVVLVSVFYNIR